MSGDVTKTEKGYRRQVVVDADACPRQAMAILKRLQKEFGFRLVTVASFHHEIDSEDHVVVGDGPDEADLAVANKAGEGDIVVTQDWGLAAMVMGKGAQAVTPKGLIFDHENVDFLLDERHIKGKYRRGGGRTKGPKARSPKDNVRFERAMRQLLDSSTDQYG